MVKSVQFAAVVAALVSTAALAAERDFPVRGFSALGVTGPYDVTVVTGGAPSVHASGEAGDLDEMKVEVRGGRLEVGPRERNNWRVFRNSKPVKVRVTVPQPLTGVSLAGSGDVGVDRVRGGSVSLDIAGSGNMTVAAFDARSARLNIAGSGDMTVAGTCGGGKLSVAGSGDIRAGKVRCETATVSIAGSGDIAVAATRTAQISIMGSGDATVTGGARCTTSKMGSGDAHCS